MQNHGTFDLRAKLFHFILRSYILTQHYWKVLHDLVFTREQHYVDVQGFTNNGKGWMEKFPQWGVGIRYFTGGDFFTEWREPEQEWLWRFEPFSKLARAFCEYWTSIKIKINMTCVFKEYEIKTKINRAGSMTTAKNVVFIWL